MYVCDPPSFSKYYIRTHKKKSIVTHSVRRGRAWGTSVCGVCVCVCVCVCMCICPKTPCWSLCAQLRQSQFDLCIYVCASTIAATDFTPSMRHLHNIIYKVHTITIKGTCAPSRRTLLYVAAVYYCYYYYYYYYYYHILDEHVCPAKTSFTKLIDMLLYYNIPPHHTLKMQTLNIITTYYLPLDYIILARVLNKT
jgi:hypothetical protein